MGDLLELLPLVILVGGWILNRMNERKGKERAAQERASRGEEATAAPVPGADEKPSDPFESMRRFLEEMERQAQGGGAPATPRQAEAPSAPPLPLPPSPPRPARIRQDRKRPAVPKDRVVRPETLRAPEKPRPPLAPVEPDRPQRPSPEPAGAVAPPPPSAPSGIRERLHAGRGPLREAVVLAEILGTPVSLR